MKTQTKKQRETEKEESQRDKLLHEEAERACDISKDFGAREFCDFSNGGKI